MSGVAEEPADFALGHAGALKLLEVEGLFLTPATAEALREFDRRGLSTAEQQQELLRRFSKAGL